MTLDELKQIVERELKIDESELGIESLRNQKLYTQFLEYKTNFEFLLYQAKGNYKRVYKEKWEYYGGKSDAKVYATKPFDLKVLKTDLSIYIESDQELIDAENKVGYYESVIKYIDGVLKTIQSRGWDIKNAIEWRKFENGF